MGRVKDEVIQLEEDIGKAIDKMEKILDVTVSNDEDAINEIANNETWLIFICNHVNDFGSSVFSSKDEVRRFIINKATELKKLETEMRKENYDV